MFLYFDHLFAEGRDRAVRPLHTIPTTLNGLYLLAMREHDRPAVLMHRRQDQWQPTPDWRFDRHVIRLALYLQEKAGFEAGDRALIVTALRPEWPLVDCAVAGLGGVSCSVAPSLVGYVHELTLDEVKQILDDSISFKPRRQMSVQFSGAEPTMSPHFLEACR